MLDSSPKQAQCLNDGGLVSLANRPQLVFKSGHQDAVHVFVISRSAELSGKKQFTFLEGRQRSTAPKHLSIAHPHSHCRLITASQPRHQTVSAGAFREHNKLDFMRPVFETALFCKCLRCQVLDCSLKQAQYLNDEGLVSLVSRPQFVFKSGHQDAVHVFVISRSAELSGKRIFTFLGGRKKASTKTTSILAITLSHSRWRATSSQSRHQTSAGLSGKMIFTFLRGCQRSRRAKARSTLSTVTSSLLRRQQWRKFSGCRRLDARLGRVDARLGCLRPVCETALSCECRQCHGRGSPVVWSTVHWNGGLLAMVLRCSQLNPPSGARKVWWNQVWDDVSPEGFDSTSFLMKIARA